MIFKKNSFRLKIFILIFIAILIPMIIVSSILLKKSEQAITDQTSKLVGSSLESEIRNIDFYLNATLAMSDLILVENRITSTVKLKEPFNSNEKIKRYADIREVLNFFISRVQSQINMSGIDSCYLYLKNQNTVIDSKTTFYENIGVNNVDFIEKSKQKQYDDIWYVSVPVNYYTLNELKNSPESDNIISYNRPIKDDNGKTLAVLAINLKQSFIGDNYDKIQAGTPGELVVMDKDEKVISHSAHNMVGEKFEKYAELNHKINQYKKQSGSFYMTIDNEKQFIIYSISKNTSWKYIVVIPASQILGKVYEVQNYLKILITITTLFVFGITIVLSNVFYNPLKKLVYAMQKIQQRDLDVRIEDNRKDEYHQVYQGFNNMADELENLIEDLINEKILKKEAEIKLLQAQINPHFLYNTLESIHSIAKIKKVEEISLMVASLSKFFRISLSGGKEFVSLKQAIELVVNYLAIQMMRFKDKIDYQISVSEELMECIVPKLILQPFVENSIYHGIESKKGKGELHISAWVENGYLLLGVKDNGIGIKDNHLIELRKSIESNNIEDSDNFALKNINRQIKLKYGLQYGIHINSKYGEGTEVLIKLPIVLNGDGSND